MKSIAVWYKPVTNCENESSEVDVELHFNLWKLPGNSNGFLRFLDIGIKLSNTMCVDELKLFFPNKIEKGDWEDIVYRFISKPGLVSAIFNENYKTISNSISKTYKIADVKDNLVFNIYQTSEENISFDTKYNGTVVKIMCPKSMEKTYFRFRICGEYLRTLSVVKKPSNSFVQSAFSQTEMIDFRVNEARDLNPGLLEDIAKEKKLNIKKAHFFFVCSYNEDVLGSHKPYISCRNLENYRWKDYVGGQSLNNQIFMAYHWKEENKDDLNFLIKTRFEKNNWLTILIYIAILLIITISFNLLSSWLYQLLNDYR